MENILGYVTCFGIIPMLLAGLLGLLLGWLLFRNKVKGDLSIEGEGALRSEADSLRARVRDLEGNVKTRDSEISGLKTKLAAGAAAAAAGAVAAKATASPSVSAGDDEDGSYALEWRNRYLAARVKYLEGKLADSPAPKKKARATAVAAKPKVKKKAPAKKAAAKKAAPKPKVLYTDGPTDGAPDDLKLIKGIGPKFEGDLNSKGIYYFRQIAAWKAADVRMVEGVIDSIPGRIKRDAWVPQARGLAKGAAPKAMKGKPKTAAKAKSATKAKTVKAKAASGPEKGSAEWYIADARRYHKTADKAVVAGIVKYCGIALRSRDTSLVACSDQKEKDTIIKGFCAKKLGQNAETAKAAVDAVCVQMKGDRFKNRATFYYLLAKNARKLSAFK